MANIGFIGLGNMGLPMAINLVKAGHSVKGFDLSQDALAAGKEAGVEPVSAVSDAVAGSEVVISMLPAGQHVRSVYTGDGGVISIAEKGTLLIDCSTIDVDSARVVNAAAVEAGFDQVDAPVSGGVGGAQGGTLTFMVGGSDEAFSRANPYLEIMGKNIFHAGGAGNGQAAKICNNMLLGICMIGTSEAFVLAEKLGLEHQKLFDIAATASGQNWSLTTYCPVPGPVPTSPANRDYEAGFSAAMMLKDLRLSQDAAQKSGAATPLGAQSAALYALLESAGHGSIDFSGIINFIRGNIDA